jgi:hypothetical protein
LPWVARKIRRWSRAPIGTATTALSNPGTSSGTSFGPSSGAKPASAPALALGADVIDAALAASPAAGAVTSALRSGSLARRLGSPQPHDTKTHEA